MFKIRVLKFKLKRLVWPNFDTALRGLKPDSALRGRPKETLNQTSKVEVWILNWVLHHVGAQDKTLNYKLLSKFQIRGCVARSRVSSSQILTTVEQILRGSPMANPEPNFSQGSKLEAWPKVGFPAPKLALWDFEIQFLWCASLLETCQTTISRNFREPIDPNSSDGSALAASYSFS